MTAAVASGEPALTSFATGLRAYQDAVTAGLALPWSSASVEGHVNRIKRLKRQMYGQANPTYSALPCWPTNLTKTVPEPRFGRG
jgi:transposase